jgi:hypothetical protein
VGIGWVVECVEKRACVDFDRFQINLEGVNVAGTVKVFIQFDYILCRLLTSVSRPAPSFNFAQASFDSISRWANGCFPRWFHVKQVFCVGWSA